MIRSRFSAKEAASLTGLGTVAMLDYLERSGVFSRGKSTQKRRGKRRQYTFRDLLVLKVLRSMLQHGVSVATLKKSLVEFQHWRWKGEPAVLEDAVGGLRFLVASASNVYFAHSAEALVQLSSKGQLAFSFILDLDRLHGELCRDLGIPTLQGELALVA